MKITLNVIGVLLLLMGSIWFLQGANVLTAGNSPMIGDSHWEYYGALAAIIGVVLLVIARRGQSRR
jgi:membrane protein implicated in regulation of membrane protease activity